MSLMDFVSIDDYEIEEPLGNGGYSSVCHAKNKKTQQRVTIKISNENDNPDFPGKNNFLYKEINVMSKLNHPCIIKYLGCSPFNLKDEQKPFYITEFCEKGPLSSLINSSEILSLNDTQILKIIYGIASGMSYLHSHHILHRDLKPENIQLDKNYNPKISNFDFSILYKPDDDNNNFEKFVGTPLYMAPEIINEENITPKSDVYSFAMILYELITHIKPFQIFRSVFRLLHSVVSGERPNIEMIKNSFKNLIMRCWSQKPEDRPSFDEIVHILEDENSGFITDDIDEKEFFNYIKFIKKSEISFESEKEVIPISEDNINQPITEQLMEQFRKDPSKIKYFMILESKQEISLLSNHFMYNKKLDISIDLDKLKQMISQKYFNLTKAIKDKKNFENDINDINKAIDEEYNLVIQQIKTKSIYISSLTILNQIIEILKNSKVDFNSIQKQINKIIDDFPEELPFNKDKLKQIPFSSTPISEILSSLNAIKQNPKFRNPLLKQQPKLSVLYSSSIESASHVQSFANILSGNCFFVTFYGKQKCTRDVLSSLSFDKIEEHQINDVITIYGPVDFVSFGKTVALSLEMLKRFNGNFPNLFFLEVSNEYEDNTMKEWCQFISFISHYLIFCSETIPTPNDIKKFKESLILHYFHGSLISCFPFSKTQINFGDEYQPKVNINIDSLSDNLLRQHLFVDIFKKAHEFIPNDTVTTLSEIVLVKKVKSVMNKDQKYFFDEAIKQNYSIQIHNKTIEYFNNLIQKMVDDVYSNIDDKIIISDFHLDESLSYLDNKAQEYLFTNIYVDFWNDKEIEMVSRILKSEVKNEFDSSYLQIKHLESIGKSIPLLKYSDYKKSQSEMQKLFEYIKGFDSTFKINSISKKKEENQELIAKLENSYKNIISLIKENQELMNVVHSFAEKLYDFLNQNPTASDQEYSKFYLELYNENNSSKNPNIEKYIDITLNIRKVLDDYRPKKFTVEIDQKSFNFGNIKLESNSKEFVLTPSMNCHDFYDLIKKSFNLNNIPFHITRLTNNQFNEPIEIEVINDYTNLSLLNSYNFTVYYGFRYYSTQVLIESLIVQKTIKITDDFVIKTNSKDADFVVNFSRNKNKWLGVEFNIENKSKKIDESDYTLVYLTMTADEVSFLQEGNLLYHQTYQDNKWVNEVDPIFLSFPDCKTAVFPLRHCSLHRILMAYFRKSPLEKEEDKKQKAETSKSETHESETSKSETSKLETSKSETSKSETSKSETSKSETSKSETSKSETSKSETSKSETSKSETPKSETSKSETSKSETSKSETHESETSKSETSKSETHESEPESQSKTIDLSLLLNSNFSRDWEKENGDKKYKRGGEPYYLPVGFFSEGIKVDKFIENTCVGFHATKATVVFNIIHEGFKLPSELPGKGVRDGHFGLNTTYFDVENFADAIFVSPSIKYASLYGQNTNSILAQSNLSSYIHVGHIEHNHILIIILQTRVVPHSFRIFPNTTRYNVIDQHYDNDNIEWRIPNKKDIFPYRILYKTTSLNDFAKAYVKNEKKK